MMELNGEPSTRRWLPSHVYVDTSEATSRMQYLISCYSLPGDPRLGLFVHDEDTLMRFQGSQQLVSRYLWCRSIGPARGA